MKISLPLLSFLFIATLQVPSAIAADAAPADGQAPEPLFREISALDSKVFDAFNHCAEPGRLGPEATPAALHGPSCSRARMLCAAAFPGRRT